MTYGYVDVGIVLSYGFSSFLTYPGGHLSGDSVCIHKAKTEVGRMVADCLKNCYQDSVTFDDVAVDFTQEEWTLLDTTQRNMCSLVILENYNNLATVGCQIKPNLISWLVQEELRTFQRGVFQGRKSQCRRTL
ncbi:zinc finger protein 426-like [Nycticebus coucang]|uniref:zinc finger protein 426-like n=1 Tax=Nycticebus coucang TaxID=9470 RepID=UPI00234C065B|nr:zinc finger protein 426-like [Nycticebus coucang]